ncbi:Septin spn4, partial [Mortierella sp. GBA35]
MVSTQVGAGIGIANLPNQRHAIASKKGSNYTILLCGESGLGKTTFINTLFTTTIKTPKTYKRRFNNTAEKTVEIEIIRA